MSAYFRCTVCEQPHASRLRARDADQFEQVVRAFGEILELCPASRTWVRVGAADLRWRGGELDPEVSPGLPAA